jgi:serine/threonine protein kinase
MVFEIDAREDQHLITTEYLDGMTLTHRIGSRSLDTDLILTLAIEIADALDAAHAEDIRSPRRQACEHLHKPLTSPSFGSGASGCAP